MRRLAAGFSSLTLIMAAVVAADAPAVAAPAPLPGSYVSLRSARLLDTRSGVGAATGTVGAHRTISVQVGGRGGVPSSGAIAVVLNVIVTAPQAGGYVTVYPSDITRPATSNLNFPAARTVANLAAVQLGTNGRVTFYNGSSGTVELIADVSGYHTAGEESPGSSSARGNSRTRRTWR